MSRSLKLPHRFSCLLLIVLVGRLSADAQAIDTALVVPPGEPAGAEARAVRNLLAPDSAAMIITAHGKGRFGDPSGGDFSLRNAKVLWLHEGDHPHAPGQFTDRKTTRALRDYVSEGGAVLLTGTTIPLINQLGIEEAPLRTGRGGNDHGKAMLRPLVKKHPAFAGLSSSGNTVMISDRGHPAFADFHNSEGPAGGMLLARTGGDENALVEYALGKGRVIVMGWRLPHYAHETNSHRTNLLRLTSNLLGYLANQKQWMSVKIRKAAPKVARPGDIGRTASDADVLSLRLAIEDLINSFGARYSGGPGYLARLDKLVAAPEAGRLDAFLALKEDALLANPLLDFEQLMLINRSAGNLALPTNWESNSSLSATGHDNEIAVLSPVSPDGDLGTIFQPGKTEGLTDLDLHFDGRRVLFSMPGKNGRWQLHEITLAPRAPAQPREIPTIEASDVDNYDACYLPDGGIIFSSTAPMIGVPCVRGSSHITNLYRLEPGGGVSRLTVDQEHNWCPTVTPDGRVMYQRWEYTDTPHAFYRLMFTMNPDGTQQTGLYGTNSYWPNAMFYSRPIPGSESKFVTIVGGHHGARRMGELVLFDTAKGRREADGVIQRIPGLGKPVEPVILDNLTRNQFPRFLHPFPLSENYFLVSCQPNNQAPWGIYLVDVFDNFLLLCEQPGRAMMEPIPIRATPVPPVIPNRVVPDAKEATVMLSDVYLGEGLRGVPRGTIKSLRVLSYNFSFRGMGGQQDRVGLDGPWDVRVILGTVPVEQDGSAHFRIPAMMPVAVQPLDEEGKAVQYMRSWFTGRPGEVLSCVGCHEDSNTTPPVRPSLASMREPAPIKPWYGPMRGFSFRREVQPVLDRHCVGCHDGETKQDGVLLADLSSRPDVNMQAGSDNYNSGAHFPPSYFELKRHIRGASIESDAHLLTPWDFHADSTRLMQLLQKGHHGVQLDGEALDRLITWIDLNTPAHGSWREVTGSRIDPFHKRRKELKRTYAGSNFDPEDVVEISTRDVIDPLVPPKPLLRPTALDWAGFPADEARRRQLATVPAAERDVTERAEVIKIAEDVTLKLLPIPPGEFVMGDAKGYPDECEQTRVRIEKAFRMGATEVTNRQYACFDPAHDSRLEHGEFLQFSVRERGYPLNAPDQPVLRVSWHEAMAFCAWLSQRTGRQFTLPTESQWEWAARAGTNTPLWFGALDTDFSKTANLADATYHSRDTFGFGLPSGAIPPWRPAAENVNDGYRVSAPVASFQPNPFGLYDMAGNVAEWTNSPWQPDSFLAATGHIAKSNLTARWAVRGGSWQDTPHRARSASRLAYRRDQKVIDVGFRVICVD